MRVEIDIDEKSYKAIKRGKIDYYDALNGLTAIVNGTQLLEHYDKVAERIQRKMKESNDFIVFNNKKYVSYSELCEILEEKDILKEGE